MKTFEINLLVKTDDEPDFMTADGNLSQSLMEYILDVMYDLGDIEVKFIEVEPE